MADVLVPNGRVTSSEPNSHHQPPEAVAMDISTAHSGALMEKYAVEKAKRFRAEGSSQFIVTGAPGYEHFLSDVWKEVSAPDAGETCLEDGTRCEILILGADFGGLVSAARLIQAGARSEDIRMVDVAGGFGGAWYFNRYPGLMCDVESYIYMPLLEELGYMPKHKYAYGPELRKHAENVAEHFGLTNKAMFQTQVLETTWDEDLKDWKTKLRSERKGKEREEFTVFSRFVVLAGGSINYPKVPTFTGIKDYTGRIFHTARWDYNYTGGSETDQQMVSLKGKRVAIIGTGATAIQVVPCLAEFAEKLYVFQRTPSSVDTRGQRETDPIEWGEKIATKEGWQKERYLNFARLVANDAPKSGVNLVDDQWSKLPSYSALMGSPNAPDVPEDVPAYVSRLHAMDLARSERVRAQVDSIVSNKDVAEKLKAYYPGWCKRPCFHDEYLQSFNRPNVQLVDTDGKGVESFAANGPVMNGTEYPVDVVILATGYDVLLTVSPASRCHIKVTGREGRNMDEVWDAAPASLHGTMMTGFPNMFLMGLGQTGLTPNVNPMLNTAALNHAHIFRKALAETTASGKEMQAGGQYPFTVEPTAEAQEAYIRELVASQHVFAGLASCGPGYFNGEGDMFKMMQNGPEVQYKLARAGAMGKGFLGWLSKLETWQTNGNLDGIELHTI